jgi:hypothetical protein
MKVFRSLLTATVLALTISAAHAHGVMKPQHGGIVEMVGHMGFELVRRETGRISTSPITTKACPQKAWWAR